MAVDSTGPLIIGLTVMFEVMAIVAVSLRFWEQRSLKRKMFADDVWIVVGLVNFNSQKKIVGVLIVLQICATALSITLILGVVLGGLGQHATELYATPWRIVAFQKVRAGHGAILIPILDHEVHSCY